MQIGFTFNVPKPSFFSKNLLVVYWLISTKAIIFRIFIYSYIISIALIEAHQICSVSLDVKSNTTRIMHVSRWGNKYLYKISIFENLFFSLKVLLYKMWICEMPHYLGGCSGRTASVLTFIVTRHHKHCGWQAKLDRSHYCWVLH